MKTLSIWQLISDQKGQTWCKTNAMGPERISVFMKILAEKAGLVDHYTNHSLRRTALTQLLHAGVSPTNIIQLSGHKNVQSLNNYAICSKEQRRAKRKILQGENITVCSKVGAQQQTSEKEMPVEKNHPEQANDIQKVVNT